jgi:hypothetical protein
MRNSLSILMFGLLAFAPAGVSAKSLTDQEQCEIEQAEAAASYVQCLSQVRIDSVREQLPQDQAELLSMECEASMLEQAESLARTLGRQCDVSGSALEAQTDIGYHYGYGDVKPQIPLRNFEWKGQFVGSPEIISDPQLVTRLIISGKWQNDYFNLYMEQGGPHEELWVKNLIFEDKLYSITYKWHTPAADDILETCFENTGYDPSSPGNPLPITVHDLNGILASSRLVGLEKVDRRYVNHYRTTCLSVAGPFPFLIQPFKVFSDIYVPPGKAYPWYKWLQFGDGVGPDPQNDEWFILNRWSNYPANIVLPKECKDGQAIEVQQLPCTNLPY